MMGPTGTFVTVTMEDVISPNQSTFWQTVTDTEVNLCIIKVYKISHSETHIRISSSLALSDQNDIDKSLSAEPEWDENQGTVLLIINIFTMSVYLIAECLDKHPTNALII